MKVVFMGTPEFSVPTLEELLKAGHHVAAVVTQPDKPKGRGKAVAYSAVKQKALEYGISVLQPMKAKEETFLLQLKEIAPDIIVVVAFGQILPKTILDLPPYGCINVHASLLPKYRGAAPIQWAVINGETESGITTMYMDVGVDTGDMILQEIIPLEKKETGGSLHDKLSHIGGSLLIQTLKQLEEKKAVRIKQEDSESTYVKILNKDMGKIDFNESAEKIERLIRGLNPWPSAFTSFNEKTLKIWDANVLEKEYAGNNGDIVEVTKNSIIVKTQKGALEILELQLEGKKRMPASTFLLGYQVTIGTRLV